MGQSHPTAHDYPSAAHGLFAILAALAARDRTGLGVHIDQAQIEVAGAIMGPMLLDYLVNGHEPGEDPPPGLVVPCLGDDSWLAVEPEDEGDWQRLATMVGAAGSGDHAAVGEALRAWAGTLTPQQAMRLLQEAGLAAGAVQNTEDVTRDPQHRERHFLQEMDHPDLGVAECAPAAPALQDSSHHQAADAATRRAHHRDSHRVAGHGTGGKPALYLAAQPHT